MAQRNSKPVKLEPRGLTDARDGTNTFPGAMASLQNFVPDPSTNGVFVPRPAAVQLADITTYLASAAQVNELLQVGNMSYGMVAATGGTYSGKDVPFAYNIKTATFLTITIPGGAASLPATPSTTGDWTPPTAAVVGGRVVFTHPGFSGGGNPFFGWLDITGFSSNTLTGNTHTSTTIDTLSVDVLTFGWQVGMTIIDSAGDIPTSPATTIVAIASDGMSATLSAAATGSHSGTTFTVAGGTNTAPLWGSGNTNGFPLSAVPVAVSNFNSRAYFAVPGFGTQFSDPALPTQRTAGTQALTAANGLDITAFGGLPITQSSGGILAALICFQGDAEMQMITGDPLQMNLVLNSLGVGVGCLAPNTICQTPLGLAFVAPDGLRYINFIGVVSDPIGKGGEGIVTPFLNAINPTRMAAAYNQDVFRVTLQNGEAIGQPMQDYWYHISRKIWTGPHTFTYSLAASYQGTPSHGFVLTSPAQLGKLITSEVTPTPNSTYTEFGAAMVGQWATCLLPDNAAMAESRVNESMLALQLPSGALVTASCLDEASNLLGQVQIQGSLTAPTVWGSFIWGAAPWSGTQGYFAQYDLPWGTSLVFKQATFSMSTTLLAGFAVGNFYFRYQPLGYRTQNWAFVQNPAPPPPPPVIVEILTETGIAIETESGVPLAEG